MPALILPYLARYWWIAAIIALLAMLKVESARLRSSQASLEVANARVTAMNQQNHELKSASDECNAHVEQMRKDGDSMRASLNTATQRADAIAAAGVQAAADTIAHPPTNDCESILRYGHQEAAKFRW